MITRTMVEHIIEKLNNLTSEKNSNFGEDLDAVSAPESGILVVLTDSENLENFTGSSNILASSTVLGKSNGVFSIADSGKTIDVINIPYSETISVNTGTAKGFAIVEVNQGDLEEKSITGNNPEAKMRKKYVIKAGSGVDVSNYKILFSGALSGDQTIQDNNSFSLSNIKITFS